MYINTVAGFNDELCSTENHPIYALKIKHVKYLHDVLKTKPEWIRADNLRIGDFVKLNYDPTINSQNLFVYDLIKNHPICDGYLLETDNRIIKRTFDDKERAVNNIINFNIMDNDFFRLLGYYISEGHFVDSGIQNQSIGFTFNINEKIYIEDIKNILESYGCSVSISENIKDNSIKITTSSKVICATILTLVGKGFDKKTLSKEITQAPLECQKHLLAGIIRGDGTSVISGFSITMHNRELMFQLRDICLRLNLYFALNCYKNIPKSSKSLPVNLRINVEASSEFAALVDKDLYKIRTNKNKIGSFNIIYREDGAYARVRLLHSKIDTMKVYDLSVEDDHSFTVNGVAVHNCNVHRTKDEIGSLSSGDHISYMMTVGSAGQGSKIYTRSLGSPVKGGAIVHSGKINYYRAKVAMINANLQNGRGGAETEYYDCFDPEWEVIQKFKNQMTPLARQVRGLDYAMSFNSFFLNKAARNEDVALFDYYKFPDLYEAMAEKDSVLFTSLYNKYLELGLFDKFVKARDILMGALREGLETGRHYLCNLTELNRHTPFKDKIYQSNLCTEISLPTQAYDTIEELYWSKYLEDPNLDSITKSWIQAKVDSIQGEVATCALGGIAIGKISKNETKAEEEYKEASWVVLDMIHTGITESDYMLHHIGYTSKKRMSAGVGVIDLAHDMARRKLSYSSQDGRNHIHKISERHYWHLLNASLELSKEFGVAEWMHKTRWLDENSWLPLDTYNRNVDRLVTIPLQYDWEEIRQRTIQNGGHAFSVLAADMPAESSGISSGCTNGLYPIRSLSLKKTNETDTIDFVAPNSDKYFRFYESAYDIPRRDTFNMYAIKQKFTDQTISADTWYRVSGSNVVTSETLLDDFLYAQFYGVPCRYYTNSDTSKKIDLNSSENTQTISNEDSDCEGCTL